MDELERLYNESFMKKDFDDACYMLWEYHCRYPQRYSWPPTLSDIKKEIDSIRTGLAYENERR